MQPAAITRGVDTRRRGREVSSEVDSREGKGKVFS